MRLILQNGYPFPYPEQTSNADDDRIADEASGKRLHIIGVHSVQWLHDLTVRFLDLEMFDKAICQLVVGQENPWTIYDSNNFVLSALVGPDDGYEHPAIIAGVLAYCGFILIGD